VTTTSRPTVVIVDDHTRFRDLTAGALCAADFHVVGVGASGAEAIALVKRHRPDLCLLDIHMPGNGIAAARSIASDAPGTVVVMLTVANDDESLFAALREGAQGYLLKGTDPDAMVAALRGVLNGEPALSRGLAMRILDELRGDTSRRVFVPERGNVALTAREAEVLELLRQGLSTAAIGRRLFISPATVRSHVAAVLKKLKAANRESALSLFESRR
jgi:DNA-binding NarL/FixJ family response regulator